MLPGGALVALLVCAPAAERYDHTGSISAVIAPGAAFSTASSSSVVPVVGPRWSGLLGGGVAIDGEGHELLLLARVTGRGGAVDVAGLLGLRAYYGDERWRTWFDLQLAVPLWPVLLVGPRLGAGVQYELSALAGVFCGGDVQLGVGANALLFTADVSCGVQLRSFVFQ